jgi:hypothetical protein
MVGFLFIQATLKSHESKIDKDELFKAVERSRMVVSTFETFYSANAERAIKADTESTKVSQSRHIHNKGGLVYDYDVVFIAVT